MPPKYPPGISIASPVPTITVSCGGMVIASVFAAYRSQPAALAEPRVGTVAVFASFFILNIIIQTSLSSDSLSGCALARTDHAVFDSDLAVFGIQGKLLICFRHGPQLPPDGYQSAAVLRVEIFMCHAVVPPYYICLTFIFSKIKLRSPAKVRRSGYKLLRRSLPALRTPAP